MSSSSNPLTKTEATTPLGEEGQHDKSSEIQQQQSSQSNDRSKQQKKHPYNNKKGPNKKRGRNNPSQSKQQQKNQQEPSKPRRPICERCSRPTPRACICEGLPETPITLKHSHILVLQHPHEARRKNRSLPLLELCLDKSSMTTVIARRFGEYTPEAVELLQSYDTVLLIFPEQPTIENVASTDKEKEKEKGKENTIEKVPELSLSGAKEYSQKQTEATKDKKTLIVVLDATWKFAKEMDKANLEHHQYPSNMKRVALSWEDPARPKQADKAFRFDIRTPPSEVHLSTTECIAWVLTALEEEGDDETEELYKTLMKPLDVMVEKWNDCRRTLGDDRDKKKRKQKDVSSDNYYGNAQVQVEEEEKAMGLASRASFFTNGDLERTGKKAKRKLDDDDNSVAISNHDKEATRSNAIANNKKCSSNLASLDNNDNTPRHQRLKYCYNYKLDVVSDGSELTDPTVFLTVSRQSATTVTCKNPRKEDNGNADGESEDGTVLARYALMGLSDMTARLVADQRLSWANTKAVFCHNNHHLEANDCRISGGGLWGLPGLLLALRQAGAPELTIVTGNDQDATQVESLLELLEVHRSYPQVHLTAVPLTSKSNGGTDIWWKLFEDNYLMVHATCYQRMEHLVYLFTCKQHSSTPAYTMALLPSFGAGRAFLDLWSDPLKRVSLETKEKGTSPLEIQAIFTSFDENGDLQSFLNDANNILPDTPVLLCRPKMYDEGILLRAQHLNRSWHSVLPNNIMPHQQRPNLQSVQPFKPISATNTLELTSCCTVHLKSPLKEIIDRKRTILQRMRLSGLTQLHPDVCRLREFSNVSSSKLQSSKYSNCDENKIDIDDDESESAGGNDTAKDENEIDIDDDESESAGGNDTVKDENEIGIESSDDEIGNFDSGKTSFRECPHLLVLGTGCAAPSPVRGSSGYGLMLPQQVQELQSTNLPVREALLLTALIECGEGTLTTLYRHLPALQQPDQDAETRMSVHLRHVKFIWISHAHLDHYGGLPAVVKAIYKAGQEYIQQKQSSEHHSNKGLRAIDSPSLPVCIVAPNKVLKYLDLALNCQKGVKKGSNVHLFRGCNPEHVQTWWPYMSSIELPRLKPTSSSEFKQSVDKNGYAYRPFAFWENIRVDHSCFHAFGFVMGIRTLGDNFTGDFCCTSVNSRQNDSAVLTFAYSGDTRPCWKLVERCRYHCNALSHGRLRFLLHEASFDDESKQMSMEKKHSTLSDALQVALDVSAEQVLLTHFSQRYDKHPPMLIPERWSNSRAACALDGLLVPIC